MALDLYARARERLARERGGVVLDHAAPVKCALAFPNTYSVAMASLGFQLVYEMLNSLPSASCERVFLPDEEDLREHVRSGVELFSLESQRPLSEFDVLAFSVSFELDYTNLLRILKLANLPLLSAERDETRPLVIAGGSCATFNPEPLAEFVDAFVIGDAEGQLSRLAAMMEEHQSSSRDELLLSLAQMPGVYVPQLYEPRYSENGDFEGVSAAAGAPPRVVRASADNLASYPLRSVISTPEAEFGDIDLVEVGRGCGRQCRFCVAGYTTRPPRSRDLSGLSQGTRLGLVGAAVFDWPGTEMLCERIVEAGGEFTVSSVRLETVTPRIAGLMAQGGQKTLTIAPEAGSARLRAVINKNSTDEQIFAAVAAAEEAGLPRVKLYFMVGLPTETDDDVRAIVDLMRQLVEQFPSISFQVSASCFVPKPWTPFQWHPMERENVLKRRLAIIQKGASATKGVRLGGESPRLARVQGFLARGDRRAGLVVAAAMENGGDYRAAVRDTGVDIDRWLYSSRVRHQALPWDHVDARISKDFLWREYDRALRGEATPACSVGACRVCGAC